MLISVLGTDYEVKRDTAMCQSLGGDGLTDRFKKEITLKRNADMLDDCTEQDVLDMYERRVLRHELIHAFFFEAGAEKYGMDEDLVDMLALLWPRMNEAMEKMGADGQ